MDFESLNDTEVINLLKSGKIGVSPTDTLYGIHGLALNKKVTERVYEIRDRNKNKPFIVLVSSPTDLKLFDIQLTAKITNFLNDHWPDKLSVILPCPNPKFFYLHRGTKSIAFRMPKNTNLLALLKETGPLISTSVNPEGQEPAYTIAQAKKYFGGKLDFYVDAGTLESAPSTLIKIEGDKISVLRQGEVKIK